MKKYFLSILIIILTIIAFPISAEVVTNSGFIPGQIWYSKDTLVEGETVNIHTAIWNGEKESLSVKVEFYDKNVILGSRDVVLSPSELKDVFVPWKITSGDHVISAKIISSLATISGKKEKVTLDRVTTSTDKQFVPVVVKNAQGESVSGTSSLKDQIDNVVPDKVSTSVANGFTVVDNFRDKTFTQVSTVRDDTQEEINLLKTKEKTVAETLSTKNNIEDATEKPIAYIKLFIFSILALIFGNKIIFYGLLAIVVFFVLRYLYRKIRNR
ncbi:MAG: hypothetical protein WC603_02765 [Candidatus Paceibacterota bacterium]|jgi:hypothetical protein